MDRGKWIIVIIGLLVLIYAQATGLLEISPSYTTAYEGAKARWIGVLSEKGTVYTNTETHNASIARFDTVMNWDPDDALSGLPNVAGEMTAVQVPLGESKWIPPDWVPSSWWRGSLNWMNPRRVFTWKVRQPDGSYLAYRMEEWVTTWYVSVSAEFDSGPDLLNLNDEAQNQRHHNVELWVEFDISPSWYFEGAEKTYFAIAKIELTNVRVGGLDQEGNQVEPSKTLSFTPESPGSILTIYLQPFRKTETVEEGKLTTYYYRNITLNPQYFRDKVYTYLVLNDFGTSEWWEGLTLKAKGDVITLGFTVVQFVVGEWKVVDVSTADDYTGRNAKVGEFELLPGSSGFMDWFTSPFGMVFSLGLLFLIILIVLAVTGVLPALARLASLIGRGGEER